MQRIWKGKRLEWMVLLMFILVVSTSLFILYTTYENYHDLALLSHSDTQLYKHQIIMAIAVSILFLAILIVYLKRDYFFLRPKDNHRALAQLLEDIKYNSDPSKVKQFKEMLKRRDHQEIYQLISSMINELQERKQQADEANATKTLFLTNISHEIRTPLNGIVGFSKLLNTTQLDREQQEFLHTIRKSSEDLIGIVDDILDIAKIESAQVEIEMSYFNIVDEFEGVVEGYAIESAIKDQELSLWIDPQLASYYVQSDSKKIRQILTNLISNAIKFTPNGGKIDLSIRALSIKEDPMRVAFTVSDTGIGISEDQRDRIFDLFTQGDNSSTRLYGGTGLGLAIAMRLVRLLGGSLELESQLGVGSSFSFILEMPAKQVKRERKIREMQVGLYIPKEAQDEHYLASYLASFSALELERFETFEACKDAKVDSFDLLYIYYDQLDKEELKRLVARHTETAEIVLVTKLLHRDAILDIAPIFSQVIYTPITYLKIEQSLLHASKETHYLSQHSEVKFEGLKALVIDDNRVNLKMIVKTLENLGIQSDRATDGAMGIELFQKNQYDMVFMDIQMPNMNGVVATQKILEYEQAKGRAHTPIVAVTTNNLKGDRERYLAVGMDEYIAKPINMEKFINVIKQFYSVESHLKMPKSVEQYDILLYKEAPTESKILRAIFEKSGYRVKIAKNIDSFIDLMEQERFRVLVLDKSRDRQRHKEITDRLYQKSIPSLLFVDEGAEIDLRDTQVYTHLLGKDLRFAEVQKTLQSMLSD